MNNLRHLTIQFCVIATQMDFAMILRVRLAQFMHYRDNSDANHEPNQLFVNFFGLFDLKSNIHLQKLPWVPTMNCGVARGNIGNWFGAKQFS